MSRDPEPSRLMTGWDKYGLVVRVGDVVVADVREYGQAGSPFDDVPTNGTRGVIEDIRTDLGRPDPEATDPAGVFVNVVIRWEDDSVTKTAQSHFYLDAVTA